MFLGMSEVVELFERRDPTRYFEIVDFIPASKERRLPNLVLPEAQPARAVVDQPASERALVDAVPDFTDLDTAPPSPLTPALDQGGEP